MKTIILKKLQLENFKGIKNLEINFNQTTNISGENGTGKTTIVDAFLWLLFDKDSTNRKDFQIKTLDENNNVIHGLNHSVTAQIEIDGKVKTIQKIYSENWTKKRGEAEKLLTGHSTNYIVDDVPLKKSEFLNFVNDLVQEDIFRIITNPFHFSNVMKWEERRNILTELVEDVEVKISGYLANLLQDKTDKELKESLSFQKKKLNEKLEEIPSRIDEVNNSIVTIDKSKLNSKDELLKELENIDKFFLGFADSRTKEKEIITKKRRELFQIKTDAEREKNNLIENLQSKKNKYKIQKQDAGFELERIIVNKETFGDSIKEIENQIKELKEEFEEISETQFVFDEAKTICPTCKQSLRVEVVEETKRGLKENFNLDKSTQLTKINEKGISLNNTLGKLKENLKEEIAKAETTEKSIEEATQMLLIIEKDIEKANSKKVELPESYSLLEKEIEELESKLNNSESDQIQTLRNRKDEISDSLQEIRDTEKDIENNKKHVLRIGELEADQTNISNQIADLEKGLFELESYTKAKAEELEKTINSKFNFVKFKLFKQQINGGITEICEPLINGVPFADANNAAKYNAGIDIINTLSSHFQVKAPIFIDNREGINDLIDTELQIINLFVTKDKSLKIS